ncbi:MAG: Nramp family divalent metal transporter, partial [Ferruginibacter sp.]|nr:Nramp family divalent metal transporter [Ferruginibacter sp.]
YIAIGIIGATVMPHNLYLHSALVQTRKFDKTTKGIKEALKYNLIDSTIALNIAFLVNAAILILAATVFFKTGNSHVAEIKEAHQLLQPLLGSTWAPKLFAIALIAAGQSSTITGTLAGQIVMEGYLSLRINPILRRFITRALAIIPALIVILIYGDEKIDALLILSQVILSLQLGFAIIPLIHFVSDKKTMGSFAIKPYVQIAAWLIATILVVLNLKMLVNEATLIFEKDALLPKILLILIGILFISLLLYITFLPVFKKNNKTSSIKIHGDVTKEINLSIPVFNQIAIALDFSENDEKLLSYAIAQGNKKTAFTIIHIVESATAKLLGSETSDYESEKDKERLDFYVTQLQLQGYNASGFLGYRNRAKEIVRLVKQVDADILVVGAHGHTGLKDFIYGETVNTVRHELKIPVLVVNL